MKIEPLQQSLAQLRAVASYAATGEVAAKAAPDFAGLLAAKLDSVNQTQQTASAAAKAYAVGEAVELNEVMVDMAKANIAFRELVTVRNKMIAAYHEIMNMQV